MTFNPQPKPQRSDRVKAKGNRQSKLISHRKRQYMLAKSRDDGWCVFCYFLKGVRTPAADVHHVYSRGKHAKDWREQYFVMLCTCRHCHPPAMHGGQGTSEKLAYVERVLCRANQTPINRHFKRHEIQ